jgi:hypothetical protein
MLKVWGRRNSLNVQKVMWLVGELGLEHEHVPAGGPFGGVSTDAYAALNPNRLVPVVEDGALAIWESHTILSSSSGRWSSRISRATTSPSATCRWAPRCTVTSRSISSARPCRASRPGTSA